MWNSEVKRQQKFLMQVLINITDERKPERIPPWKEAIQMVQNFTNNTNLTSLDDWPEGAMRGDPIILHFEPEFEEGQRGVSETKFMSTMVEVINLY